MSTMTRREFLATLAGGAAALGLADGTIAQAGPKRAAVPPGGHEAMPLPFDKTALKGISEQVVTWHHDRHYAGYVNGRNDIEKELAGLNPAAKDFDAKKFGGLKRQETFNACGQILHENYFAVLGGDGQMMASSPVGNAIRRDFGSYEAWVAELRATATAAGIGWGVTCFDPSSNRLRNFLVELHQLGAVWTAVPIVALDGWEHAYYHDYGPDKAKYFDAFFQNLHWGRINALYSAASGETA